MKLITWTPFPPNGFSYIQNWKGVDYTFPDVGLDVLGQSNVILKFRKANGVPGADLDTVISDLSIYTCARLGNSPRFCSDGTNVANPMSQGVRSKGCGGCGARL